LNDWDEPSAVRYYLNLRIDVHVVKQDQLAAAAISVHDAVLVHCTGDSMQETAVKEMSSPAASRSRTARRISVTSISTKPWMKCFRRLASKL
jgi:hypothetical protein